MKRATISLGILLFGCVPIHPTTRDVELMVYPSFKPHIQAGVVPITLSNIATLDIIPYIQVSADVYNPISSTTGNPTAPDDPTLLKLTQASSSIDPARPFVLRRLKPNKTYRIYAKAYNSSNSLISVDASSYTEVSLGNNDAPTLATLPVNLINTPFGATTAVTVNTSGRYDYLKSTLYLISDNSLVAVSQTTRNSPTVALSNLQAQTNYKFVSEAYKSGIVAASNSITISVTDDDSPATSSLSLTIPYVVSTLAGQPGVHSYSNGVGTAAAFYYPSGLAVDAGGNIFLADYSNHLIRKISSDGVVSTFAGGAGTTTNGFLEGTGTAAKFNGPKGVAMDSAGNLYVPDRSNQLVRKVTPDAVVSRYVGQQGTYGYLDGTGTAAKFNYPEGICIDNAGNIYVADTTNNCIRKVTSDLVVTTLAGGTTAGFANGVGAAAKFYLPVSVAADNSGNVYVADQQNNLIRKITSDGTVTTFAGGRGTTTGGIADGTGTAALLKLPYGLNVDSVGNIYVADSGNNRIRRITPDGVVTTLAGNTSGGTADGIGSVAQFNGPRGVALDSQGNIYVSDFSNHTIRVLK